MFNTLGLLSHRPHRPRRPPRSFVPVARRLSPTCHSLDRQAPLVLSRHRCTHPGSCGLVLATSDSTSTCSPSPLSPFNSTGTCLVSPLPAPAFLLLLAATPPGGPPTSVPPWDPLPSALSVSRVVSLLRLLAPVRLTAVHALQVSFWAARACSRLQRVSNCFTSARHHPGLATHHRRSITLICSGL